MSENTSQSYYLRTIVGKCLVDDAFKQRIIGKSVQEIKSEIDDKNSGFEFTSDSLTQSSLDSLASITINEFETLKEIYQKVKDQIMPNEML